MYWQDIHETMTLRWIESQTPLEQYRVYTELSPRLKHMGRAILNRYFQVNHSRSEEIVQTAVNTAMINIRTAYDPGKKTRLYSLMQTIIKNYFIDELTDYRNTKKRFNNSIGKIDDYEFLYDILPDRTDHSYNEMYEALMVRFKEMREELKTHVFSNFAIESGNTRMKLTAEKYINACIEYLEKFGVEINFLAMNEYISNKLNISDYHLSICSNYFFKMSSSPVQNADKESQSDKPKDHLGEPIVNNKYVNDDICPNDNRINYNRKFRNKNKVEFEYF